PKNIGCGGRGVDRKRNKTSRKVRRTSVARCGGAGDSRWTLPRRLVSWGHLPAAWPVGLPFAGSTSDPGGALAHLNGGHTMFRLHLGSGGRYCDGLDRRSFLALGVAGLASVGLPKLLEARAASAAKKNTSVILLWLDGGPSHMDLYDMKPDAPA